MTHPFLWWNCEPLDQQCEECGQLSVDWFFTRFWSMRLSISSMKQGSKEKMSYVARWRRWASIKWWNHQPSGSNPLNICLHSSLVEVWRHILKLNMNFLKSEIIDNLFCSNLLYLWVKYMALDNSLLNWINLGDSFITFHLGNIDTDNCRWL